MVFSSQLAEGGGALHAQPFHYLLYSLDSSYVAPSTPPQQDQREIATCAGIFNNLLGPGTKQKQGSHAGPPGYIGQRNRFLGIDFWAPISGLGIDSLESISGLHRSLKIPPLYSLILPFPPPLSLGKTSMYNQTSCVYIYLRVHTQKHAHTIIILWQKRKFSRKKQDLQHTDFERPLEGENHMLIGYIGSI